MTTLLSALTDKPTALSFAPRQLASPDSHSLAKGTLPSFLDSFTIRPAPSSPELPSPSNFSSSGQAPSHSLEPGLQSSLQAHRPAQEIDCSLLESTIRPSSSASDVPSPSDLLSSRQAPAHSLAAGLPSILQAHSLAQEVNPSLFQSTIRPSSSASDHPSSSPSDCPLPPPPFPPAFTATTVPPPRPLPSSTTTPPPSPALTSTTTTPHPPAPALPSTTTATTTITQSHTRKLQGARPYPTGKEQVAEWRAQRTTAKD
ncbi:hypothetical protein BJ508DRAFT_11170 [Ascobolus immersus RN42]|uniref:Uncharacterized protein n=1 Tax=Ascobolus immersus RN42 TaxID=1160509 RepID=A0A3N4HQI1_ASCIM|nr:hypothetical protein BJ508DRAFT_11170 [Ascobolus immersus RN42]